MKLVFMGTPDFAVQSLKALLDSNFPVEAVFTREDKPKNRGMKLAMPPVKELAIERGLQVYQPKNLKTDEALSVLKQIAPDIIIVAAYGALLPESILQLPKYGCINVHASLLPKYRGASPINAAILNGDEYAGVTIMQMAEGIDTGDILRTAQTKIGENETYGSLQDRLALLGGKLLVETVQKLAAGEIVPQKQDESLSTSTKLIHAKDVCVSFEAPNYTVSRKIRGYSPTPGAYSTLGQEKIKLFDAELSDNSGDAGAILSCDKNGVTVACAQGAVIIKEVQGVGGKRMSADAFFRGHSKLLAEKFV